MRRVAVWLCLVLLPLCNAGISDGTAPVGLEQQAALQNDKILPTAVAWILFGGMVMIMVAFYLVSYKDEDISNATWLVICNAVSLFCAVLLFLAFRELVALATDGEDIQDRRLGPASGADWGQCWDSGFDSRRLGDSFQSRRLVGVPTQRTLLVDAFCVVFMFCFWETILFVARKKERTLAAVGLISGHCIGFSTLYAFGNMQQCEPFRDSPGFSFVVVVATLLAGFFLSCISKLLRFKLTAILPCCKDSRYSHDVHNWHHQCKHVEREALAFAVSFVLAQVLHFISVNELAPLHAVPKGRDLADAGAELGFIAGLAISVVAAGFTEHRIAHSRGHQDLVAHKHGHEMSWLQLAMHMVKDTLAFTAGWNLLALVKLVFWSATDDKGLLGEGDVMTSHLVIVFISSVLTFVTFFAIDFSADRIHGDFSRGLRSLGKAFMLLLGLAWEGAFWEGAHSMSQGMGLEDQTQRMLCVAVLSLAFSAIVMPAWIMYIVPYTLEVEEESQELHIKDYDDHKSPKASDSSPEGTGSMVTMKGDTNESISTCDNETLDRQWTYQSTQSSAEATGALGDPITIGMADLESAADALQLRGVNPEGSRTRSADPSDLSLHLPAAEVQVYGRSRVVVSI